MRVEGGLGKQSFADVVQGVWMKNFRLVALSESAADRHYRHYELVGLSGS